MQSLRFFAACCVLAAGWAAPMGVQLPRMALPREPWENYTDAHTHTGVFNNLALHCSAFFAKNSEGVTEMNKQQWGWTVMDGYPSQVDAGTPAYCLVGSGCVNTAQCTDDWSRKAPYVKAGAYILSWKGTGSVIVRQPPAGPSVVSGATATLAANTPFAIEITQSDVVNAVRDIVLQLEGASGTFTESFLSSLAGVQTIDFCSWVSMTDPATPYQYNGVAVQHALALSSALSSEALFCSPLEGDTEYASKLVAQILQNPPKRTYITTDPLRSHMVSQQEAPAKRIFSAARSAWVASSPLTLVARLGSQWVGGTVAAFEQTFQLVDAIGLDAGFGSAKGKTPAMMEALGVDTDGGWRYPHAAQQDVSAMLAILKDLQLSAEVGLWEELSYVRSVQYVAGKELIGWNAMPLMRSRRYDFREGLQMLTRCTSEDNYPCSVGNTGVVVKDSSVLTDDFFAALRQNATSEEAMHNMIVEASTRSEVGTMYADHLRRWAHATSSALIITGAAYAPVVHIVNGSVDAHPDTRTVGNVALANSPPWHNLGGQNDPRWVAAKAYAMTGTPQAPELPGAPFATECSVNCIGGSCYKRTCVCWAGRTGSACDEVTTLPSSCGTPSMDLNPGGLADWSAAHVFWDYMKQGRGWVAQDFTSDTWDTKTPVQLTGQGYPASLAGNQKVGTMLIRDINLHGRSGWYVLTWEGDGIVDVSLTSVRKVRRVAPGRVEVLVVLTTDANNGVFVSVLRTNPADVVRNIRFVPSWVEEEARYMPFQPHIVSLYKEFSSLRFMNWGRTNSDFDRGMQHLSWGHRTQLTDRTYTGKTGVPYEVMIQVANVAGSNPWFCVPHLADDGFVASLATLVHNTLQSDLVATIEYSNEAWGNPDASAYGGLHSGGIYASLEGAKVGISHYCWIVKRTREYRDIIVATLGEDVASQRFRFVLAAQAGYAETGRVMLGITAAVWMTACTGTAARAYEWVDALAIAPYAGGDLASDYAPTSGVSNDGAWVGEAIEKGTLQPLEAARNMSQEYKAIIDKANEQRGSGRIRFTMYEGGLHFGYPTTSNIPLNFHPAIGSVVAQYWAEQEQRGFDSMMQFIGFGSPGSNWDKGGDPFAMLNSPFTQAADAPKFEALVSYMRGRSGCRKQLFASFTSNEAVDCVNGQPCASGRCDNPPEWVGAAVCSCAVGTYGLNCEHNEPVKVEFCGYQCGQVSEPHIFERVTINGETTERQTGKGTCGVLPPGRSTFAKGVWHRSSEKKIIHTCKCHPPFYGAHCELFDCPKHCNWQGTCKHPGIAAPAGTTIVEADPVCECYRGFQGSLCEVDCGCMGDDGQVHGTCSGEVCQPDWGWKGKQDQKGLEWDCPCSTCSAPGACACPECDNGTCFKGQCLCWIGYEGDACSTPIPEGDLAKLKSTWHSVNVGGVNYWSQSWPFVQVFQQSSEWTSVYRSNLYSATYEWGNGQKVRLAQTGLPRLLSTDQALSSLVNRNTLHNSPNGVYTMLWKGDAVLRTGMDARELTRGKGMLTADFQGTCAGRGKPGDAEACALLREGLSVYVGDNGWLTHVDKLGPEPLEEINVVMPGFADRFRELPFHPLYIHDLLGFKTIRFHPWIDQSVPGAKRTVPFPGRGPLSGGRSPLWSERPRIGSKFHVDGGHSRSQVPWEYMVDLCNILHTTPWFTVPPSADVQWVKDLAGMVGGRLRADQNATFEYGNEMWNPLFIGAEWAADRGTELGLHDDRAQAQYMYYAQRSVELCRAWKQVLGQRGRCVLAGWTGQGAVNSLIMEHAKDFALKSDVAVVDVFNAFAVAAYYNCGLGQNGAQDVLLSVTEMITRCKSQTSIDSFTAALSEAKSMVATYGVPLISYEAGPHIVESAAIHQGKATPGLTEKFIELSRASAMQEVYTLYMNAAKPHIDEWLQFTYTGASSRYGSFGLKEHTGQYPDPPKFLAVYEQLPLSHNEVSCLDARTSYFGLGLTRGVFTGPPFVTSPTRGETYEEVTLTWNKQEMQRYASTFHRVMLRELGSCSDLLKLSAEMNEGSITFSLPHASYKGLHYVSIAMTNGVRFYSEPFTNKPVAERRGVAALTRVTVDPPKVFLTASIAMAVQLTGTEVDPVRLQGELNAAASRMGRGAVVGVVLRYLCTLGREEALGGITDDMRNDGRCEDMRVGTAQSVAACTDACVVVADIEVIAKQTATELANTVAEVAHADGAQVAQVVTLTVVDPDLEGVVAPEDAAGRIGLSLLITAAASLLFL